MKKAAFLVAILIALTSSGITTFGQTRPKKRTTAPVSKPEAAMPTEVETVPVKKAVVEVSPAQVLFNQGLKCEAKDYDCQISNYTKAINLNLNTIDVFKNRGNAYLAKGDFEKGIGDFTKAIDLDKNDVSGYKTRGKAFYETAKSAQDLNNALKDFDSAIELEPKDVEALNYRGLIYSRLADFEKASADFDKVISLSPNNVDAYINRGNVFLRLKNFDKAIENFNRAISLKPDDSDAYASRGYAYLAQNKNDLALKDLTKAIELAPTKAEAYGSRGEIYEKDKKYDEAIKDYSKVIELEPKSGYVYFKRGSLYRLNKKEDEARNDFTKAIEFSPNSARAYEIRCITDYNYPNVDKAIEDCSKAISINPQNVDAYLKRASAYMKTPGYVRAMPDYDSVIALNPNLAEAYKGRGKLYGASGDSAKQVANYSKAVELNPNDIDSVLELYDAMLFNRKLEESSSEYEYRKIEMYKVIDRGIEFNPRSGRLYSHRGVMHRIDGRYEKSITDFNKALELYGFSNVDEKYGYINTLAELAKTYHELKNDGQALSILTKAIELHPASGRAYYNRGMFYGVFLRDFPKAIEDFNKGVEVSANNEYERLFIVGAIEGMEKERINNANKAIVEKERKKEKRKQNAMAILQGVQTITNVLANSSTPKTSPPVQQTPQPNTSGSQTSSTNASSTNSSTNTNNSNQNTSTTGGNTTPKRSWASIAQVSQPSENCSKSSYLPASQPERCWGSWQATVFPQIQIRVKGPLAVAGNLVNDDARYKATYDWYIQVKNTSNEIISVEDEIIFGDGKVTKQGFTVTPGGTAYHDTMTLSAAETINYKLSNFESCKHWTKEGNMYRCSE